jgi:endonuclease/exonuclease/phosphatase family metal-dependent hydrolase
MKLLQLNTYGMKGRDTSLEFIKHEQADILCLQEVGKDTVTLIENMGYEIAFAPMTLKDFDNGPIEQGVLIASRSAFRHTVHYYHQPADDMLVFDRTHIHNTVSNIVLVAEIELEGSVFWVATTHFTWTPHGNEPNAAQRTDLPELLATTASLPPHVLTGDFNIPRGHNELYPLLTEQYIDTVPKKYTSSLDKTLHRHKDEPKLVHLFTDYMVDYIFTQPPYTASNVRLEFGVSDHAAVIADISKE